MRVARLGTMVALLVSLFGVQAALAPESSAWDRYVHTVNGGDRATFDRVEGDFTVCDNEKDGRAVYAYFSGNSDTLYYDTDGSGGSCGHWYGYDYRELGIMYVCEEKWGPDNCSRGVVLGD